MPCTAAAGSEKRMRVLLRPATADDAPVCGRVCYEAFGAIAREHRFPVDWHSEEVAVNVMAARLAHRLSYGVVAEVDGRIVGSAFLKESAHAVLTKP